MIIVDTNVIIAFLISDGITRKIISRNAGIFVTPEHCFEEAWAHRAEWNRNKLSDNELREILDQVGKLFIHPVPRSLYSSKEETTSHLITDPDDVPVLALALTIQNEGLWTHDRDFSSRVIGERIRILTTSDVKKAHPPNREK